MAALAGSQIRGLLEHDDPNERLIISPLLEPTEQLRDHQASIDVRLGFEFALISPSSHEAIDEISEEASRRGGLQLDPLYRKTYVPFGRSLVIHPHQFILGMTLEYLRLPPHVLAYVIGRSTWGRLGLIVATAIGVHPGFAGCLILELRNLGETPLSFTPVKRLRSCFSTMSKAGLTVQVLVSTAAWSISSHGGRHVQGRIASWQSSRVDTIAEFRAPDPRVLLPELLAPGGSAVIKLVRGAESDITAAARRMFERVQLVRPEATHRGSSEIYLVALGYRPGRGSAA